MAKESQLRSLHEAELAALKEMHEEKLASRVQELEFRAQ